MTTYHTLPIILFYYRTSLLMNRRSSHHFYENQKLHNTLSRDDGFHDNIGESNHMQLHHHCNTDTPTPIFDSHSKTNLEKQIRETEKQRMREIRREKIRYEEINRTIDKIEAKARRSREVLIENKLREKLNRATRRKGRHTSRRTGTLSLTHFAWHKLLH